MKIDNKIVLEEMKRFQQIMEYTTVRKGILGEAEPDNEEQPQEETPEMDTNASIDGGKGMPDDMGTNPNDVPQQQGGDMPMDNDTQGGPDGFNPQVPQDSEVPEEGGIQPEDDVIDISDLTDSQEKTEEEIEKMDDRFDKVMKYLGKFEELIKANDEKINDLMGEIEKRNPTQVEKLSMQTAKSYPFNVTPEDYWKEKEATSNYRVEDDDNGKEQDQYVITKDDVDGAVDWKTISDTLNGFDPYHQTIKNTTLGI